MRVVDLLEDEQQRWSDEVEPDETKGGAGNVSAGTRDRVG